MEVPVVALAARITRWAVGWRRSHPFVSISISRWAETTGRSASDICSWVATSVRTSVRPRWSCGAGVGGFGRFTSVHCWNQTRACLSAQRENGAARTRGDLTATACRNAKTSSQIVCDGGQRLGGGRFGGGLLRLTWLFRLRGFDHHNAIVVAGLVGTARGIRVRRPLRDGAGENLQELARI